MALAAVPVSVLSKIRQLILISSGRVVEKNIIFTSATGRCLQAEHLGGWGLRNLFIFNRALAANSLWRVLMKEGIWHQVIKDKYLPYTSVATWLRSTTVIQPLASQIWKNLLKSLPLITHWLSWNPGNGHSVLIGLDKIWALVIPHYSPRISCWP
jgi:hypothetical protein